MPEWALQLLVAGGGLTIIATAVGKVFNAWREGRQAKRDEIKADRERKEATAKALQDRTDRLEAKVESLLMDAIAREKETNKQLQERIEMDARQSDVISAATQALKEATVTMAALKRPPQ